ncbi:hypothetical protein MNV49_003839 [Pseudohyphozyma bogoriensis]|nr:hypothetical protein MNV49_003839 [Pseudohyphozyma bogoriensis]
MSSSSPYFVETAQGWPVATPAVRSASFAGYLVAICVLTVFIHRRTFNALRWREVTVARVSVLVLLVAAFAGVVVSCFTLFGVTLDHVGCHVALKACLVAYFTVKVSELLFLVERVYIVYSNRLVSRLKSPVYYVFALVASALLALGVVSMVNDHTNFNEGVECHMKVDGRLVAPFLSILVLSNLGLAIAFAIPLFRARFQDARSLAIKSIVSSLVSLLTTAANNGLWIKFGFDEKSWVCLGLCSIDLFVNAMVIFFTTTNDTVSVKVESAIIASGYFSPRLGSGPLQPPPPAFYVPSWKDVEAHSQHYEGSVHSLHVRMEGPSTFSVSPAGLWDEDGLVLEEARKEVNDDHVI